MLQNTYLHKVFKHNKLMGSLVLLYILASVMGAAFRHEEFPVFLYGMYSMKEAPQATYTSYKINVNGQTIDYSRLLDPQREVILSPLFHLVDQKNTTANQTQLTRWLFAYIADMRLVENNTMQIDELTCSYQPNGEPVVLSTKNIIQYNAYL